MSRLYGSLQNRLAENMVGRPEPQVGLGMTEYLWSDRHAYRIVSIEGYMADKKRPKEIRVVPCWVRCKDFYAGDWEVSMAEEKPEGDGWHRHWDGAPMALLRTRKGNWTESGREDSTHFCVCLNPSEYEDPSF